jgi:hypothetical protein
MLDKPKMSSVEFGALWLTYHKKGVILRMLEHFIKKADDPNAKELMSGMWERLHLKIIEMKTMIEEEGAVSPEGFTEEDVNLAAPKLWENGFDIMFSRILKEISFGLYALHLPSTYRQDIIELYKDLTNITEEYYGYFTHYLLENKFLSRPTYINMPKTTSYITDKSYVKGINLIGNKRPLNTVEFNNLYRLIETNISGMQLLDGFAQTTEDEDVKKYFIKGRDLCKEIISELSAISIKDHIQLPATPGGTVTNSTEAPFSGKLMMYCNYLLSGLSLGAGGFSGGFSLRNDLQTKYAIFAKDIFEYQREGTMIMISKGWLEEPPKMDL